MINNLKQVIKNKNILWNMIGISANSFYSLILVIFITRFNSVEAAGQFSFAFYMASVFQPIGNYGGRIYQVSDYNKQFSESNYVSLKYLTGLAMLVIALVFCFLNGYHLVKISLILTLTGYRFLESISDAYYGVLQKNDNLAQVGKGMTIKILIGCLLFVGLDLVFQDVTVASLGFLIAFFIVLIVYDIPKSKRYEKIKIQINEQVIKLLKSCFKVFLFSFLSIMILNITRYFVDADLSDTIQGYYGILIMPSSLIALSTQFVVQPMIKTLSDRLHQQGIEVFSNNVNKMLLGVGVFGVVCAIITYFIGVDVLTIVYGIDFMDFRLYLSLMILAGIFSGISSMISTILTIMRKLDTQMIAYSISTVVTVAISFILVGYFKDIYAALNAYLIAMFTQLILLFLAYYIQIRKERKTLYEQKE